MELVPKIDAVKTYDNVSSFFKDDLEKIILMSGSRMVDLSSPSFEENYGSSEVNSIENKLINGLDAQNVVKSVHDALYHGVDPVSQRILMVYTLSVKDGLIFSHSFTENIHHLQLIEKEHYLLLLTLLKVGKLKIIVTKL